MTTPVVEPVPRDLGRLVGRRVVDWAPAAMVFVLGIAAWEILVEVLNVQRFLLPKPSEIVSAFWNQRRELWPAGWYTFREALHLGHDAGYKAATPALEEEAEAPV